MAQLFGVVEGKRHGVLEHNDIKALILRRSGNRAAEVSCGKCATHIERMSSTSDQGGITTKYGGKSVFHCSYGKRGGNDGCSVFFTLTEGSGTVLTAALVAVGWHVGATDHVYLLDWGKGSPFFTGNRLDTTIQHQRGNFRPAQ